MSYKYTFPVAGSVYKTAGVSDWLDNEDWHMRVEGGYAVDISAPHGNNVVAVADGVVHKLNSNRYYCDVLKMWVDHWAGDYAVYLEDDNYVYIYAHLSASIADGTHVKQGDVIGKVGTEGCSTGDHLHFSVIDKSAYVPGSGGGHVRGLTSALITNSKKPQQGAGVDAEMLPHDSQGGVISSTEFNQLPIGAISLVPEKVGFVIDGKTDKYNWELVFPAHNGVVGGCHGEASTSVSGHLSKVIFTNHNNNVVGEIPMDVVVKSGDVINYDFTWRFHATYTCRILDPDNYRTLLHYMTDVSLGYHDGHTKDPWDNSTYDKSKDGDAEIGLESFNELRRITGLTFGQEASQSGGTLDTKNLSGVAKEVADYLHQHLPKEVNNKALIAGILGNAMLESSMDPHKVNPDPNSGAVGLWQWLGDRRTNLYKFCGVSDITGTTVEQQCSFMLSEITSDFSDYSNAGKTPESNALWFERVFEKSGGQADGGRTGYARQYYNQLDYKDTVTTPSTPGMHPNAVFVRR